MFSQKLIWIHQEEWQQKLCLKYGNTISLIDATYKTTKYDLPLFFVCVRTNVVYCVVAEFAIQDETTQQILEALTILRVGIQIGIPHFSFVTILRLRCLH